MNPVKSFLVFLHPEIISHLKSMGIFDIEEIGNSKYLVCSTVQPSTHALGFIDLTLPKIQDDQDFVFSFSIPNHFVLYACWAEGQSVDKILGFRSNSIIADDQHG